jgi:hypothetical protein
MNIPELLQSISLLAVTATLIISVVQNRQALRQTSELSRQTDSIKKSLEQSAYQELNTTHDAYRIAFLKDDAAMLRWYLATRGYATSTPQHNRRTLYIMMKLDNHEENFINHRDGLLPEEIWKGWHEVLNADVKIPEFRRTWINARRFYSASFVDFVDTLMTSAHDA